MKLLSSLFNVGQTQPKFMANRDVFEAREKKSRIYSWQAFIFGEIVAEVPYLLVCAFLYWSVPRLDEACQCLTSIKGSAGTLSLASLSMRTSLAQSFSKWFFMNVGDLS